MFTLKCFVTSHQQIRREQEGVQGQTQWLVPFHGGDLGIELPHSQLVISNYGEKGRVANSGE